MLLLGNANPSTGKVGVIDKGTGKSVTDRK